ncbi:paraneoplastic antigen Ma1 homolog [Neoarius graeffei]|uniref:paraneoplastic antigen Ma1 homolog n=1 Tax=Neoarius graeffei TaxID=443677 RepID=UPI00298CB1FF|nr:paraneoplastic antigen Ma1 homolog [Neoarius graeffei]
MSLLSSWCKGEGVHPRHAVVVSDVSDDIETQKLVVLCECREVVRTEALPSEVKPSDGSSPWALSGPDDDTTVVFETKGTNPSTPKLSPRPSRCDAQSEPPPPDAPASIPVDTFFKVIENLIEKTSRPYEGHAFKQLHVFSGVFPTPAGEESLDAWLEQARLTIDESELPSREKRKRIIECLKGPAFDILSNDPNATLDDFLTALEKAFGSTESGEDLYIVFRSMQQHSGESLSDFLRRLEHMLTKVVWKGGLHPSRRDQARVEQLLHASVHQFNATENTTSSTSEAAHLRSEIDDLKAQLSRLSAQKSSTRSDTVEEEPMQSRGARAEKRNATPDLQQQVNELQHQLQAMAVTLKDHTA